VGLSGVATAGHPFWLPELREWVPASAVRAGDLLQTSAGTWVQVVSVRAWTASHRLHNLTVDELHTYHVLAGDVQVLVHNARPPRQRPRPDASGPHTTFFA